MSKPEPEPELKPESVTQLLPKATLKTELKHGIINQNKILYPNKRPSLHQNFNLNQNINHQHKINKKYKQKHQLG